MASKEYNNIFNQGVEAAGKSLDKHRQKPKEGETKLTEAAETFNKLIDLFQSTIKDVLK